MQTAMSTGTKTSERPGITYRIVCQNPDAIPFLICE